MKIYESVEKVADGAPESSSSIEEINEEVVRIIHEALGIC